MMKNIFKKVSVVLAVSLGFAASAGAQDFLTGYFLDNYSYGYRINPSIMFEKSFMGVGVGSISANLQSNLGMDTFLYPTENGLVTGLNSAVSSEEFLGKMKDINSLALGLDYNLFSVGRRSRQSMSNFEVNIRSDFSASIPRDLFAFLKNGSSQDAYDFSGFNAQGNAMIELAFGGAKMLANDQLIIGYRIKALAGAANLNLHCNKATATVNQDKIAVEADAQVDLSTGPAVIGTKDDGTLDFSNIALDLANYTPQSFGGAIDLGVTYMPSKNLKITAGITDLGMIRWSYNLQGIANGSYEWKGMENVDVNNADGVQEELKKAWEELQQTFQFKAQQASFTTMEMIPFTANAGIRYRLPYVRRISLGALATYRNSRYVGWYDMRAGMTITPLNILSITANYGVSTFGPVCGAALSLNLLGINAYVGVDGYSGAVAPLDMSETFQKNNISVPEQFQTLPLPISTFRYNLTAGVTIQIFGKRHNDFTKYDEI